MKHKIFGVGVLLICAALIPDNLSAQTPPILPRPPLTVTPAPLSITPGPQPYQVARTCELGKPLVTINVVVTNTGGRPLPAQPYRGAIMARDEAKPAWAGGAPLPALAPGARANVAIPMLPSWKSLAAGGVHRFAVSVDLFQVTASTPVVVNLPAGLCGMMVTQDVKIINLSPIKEGLGSSGGGPAGPAATGGTPTPRGNTSVAVPDPTRLARELPAPAGLTSTVDSTACGDRAGPVAALGCKAALDAGQLVLVWSWGKADVDGFRVYDVSGSQRVRISGLPGKNSTFYVVAPIPQGGYIGKCYAVTVYRGSTESPPSDAFCVGTGRVVQVVAFTPQHTRAIERRVFGNTGAIGASYPEQLLDWGALVAGFTYRTRKAPAGDSYDNLVARLAVHFDTSSILHKTIRSAKLKLTVDTTTLGSDYHTDHFTSCAARIGIGKEYWWNYHDWINTSVILEPGTPGGPDVVYDVTPIVRDWANGSPNFGFVLLGEDENLGAFIEKSCRTTYFGTGIQLEVAYF